MLLCLLGCQRGPRVGGPPVLEFSPVQAPELPVQTLGAVAPDGSWLLVAANSESQSLKVSRSQSGRDWSSPEEVPTGLPIGPYSPYEVQLLKMDEGLLFLCKFTSKEDLDLAFKTQGDALPHLRTAVSSDGEQWQASGNVALVGIPGVQLLEDADARGDRVAAVGRFSLKRIPLYRSPDRGASWQASELELLRPPKNLEMELTTPDPNSPPQLSVDKEGRVHLAFPYQNGALYLRTSDGTRPDLVEFLPGTVPSRGVVTGLNQTSGDLYRLRALQQSGSTQLLMESSADSGLSWTEPFVLHQTAGQPTRLNIVGQEKLLLACWQEGTGLYCCASRDGGQSWSAGREVGPIQGRYSALIHQQKVLLVGHDSEGRLHLVMGQ